VADNAQSPELQREAVRRPDDKQELEDRVESLQGQIDELRPFSIGDNATNYTRQLPVNPICEKLNFESFHTAPFMDEIAMNPRAASVVYLYSIGRALIGPGFL
jgi:hypothetical protein